MTADEGHAGRGRGGGEGGAGGGGGGGGGDGGGGAMRSCAGLVDSLDGGNGWRIRASNSVDCV